MLSVPTPFGPWPASVSTDSSEPARPFRAHLSKQHPRMTAVTGAIGETEHAALAALSWAAFKFASEWPEPTRPGVTESRELLAYVRAATVEGVWVMGEGVERFGWAVGWRGTPVWVCWDEGGLDSTAWVAADQLRRR